MSDAFNAIHFNSRFHAAAAAATRVALPNISQTLSECLMLLISSTVYPCPYLFCHTNRGYLSISPVGTHCLFFFVCLFVPLSAFVSHDIAVAPSPRPAALHSHGFTTSAWKSCRPLISLILDPQCGYSGKKNYVSFKRRCQSAFIGSLCECPVQNLF